MHNVWTAAHTRRKKECNDFHFYSIGTQVRNIGKKGFERWIERTKQKIGIQWQDYCVAWAVSLFLSLLSIYRLLSMSLRFAPFVLCVHSNATNYKCIIITCTHNLKSPVESVDSLLAGHTSCTSSYTQRQRQQYHWMPQLQNYRRTNERRRREEFWISPKVKKKKIEHSTPAIWQRRQRRQQQTAV